MSYRSMNAPRHSAIVYVLLAIALGWGTLTLWQYGQAGRDDLAIVAAVAAFFCVRAGLEAVRAFRYGMRHRRQMRAARKASKTHGQARWAGKRDIKKAGLFKRGGLFLGSVRGRDLYYNGESHMMVMAPSGAGKGVSVVVPNLLLYNAGSMIVADPKGELTAMTARHRREVLGHDVIVLNPWREKLANELSIDLSDDGFNPLSIVKPGPEVKDDAELIASLILPGKANMSGTDEFFTHFGRSIITAFILYRVSRGVPERVTLPEIRRMVMSGPDEFRRLLDEMSLCDDFSGCIREYAGKLRSTLENAPEEFQGGKSSAEQGLSIYDAHGPLGKHVSTNGFDLSRIKEKKTTVYLIMPSDRAGTHAGWLNLVVSLAMELVGRDRTTKRVVFLLDELANLGYLPGVLRGMSQYRSQGVQVVGVVHLIAQLRRIYGRDGWHEFFGLSELIQTFGSWEFETIELISRWMGQSTVKEYSQTIQPDATNFLATDFSSGASNTAKALMRPEDIRGMKSDRQLIFYKNLQPIEALKVSYLKRRSLRQLADPNPYHRKR